MNGSTTYYEYDIGLSFKDKKEVFYIDNKFYKKIKHVKYNYRIQFYGYL